VIDGYDITVSASEKVNVWWRSDEYVIHESARRGDYIGIEDSDALNAYRPLEEAPDLFLKFAKLHEEPDFDRAALAWSRQYGLPGRLVNTVELGWFQEEASRAWGILKMYEAALKRDTQIMWSFLDSYLNGMLDFEFWLDEDNISENYLLRLALSEPARLVEDTVNEHCRQTLVVEGSQYAADPTKVKGVWEFENLLGAMYLQMYWLMASGGDDVSLCGYCGQIISLARPYPEGRKRRQDRKHCDDACRQAHHRSKKRASM